MNAYRMLFTNKKIKILKLSTQLIDINTSLKKIYTVYSKS